MRKPKIFFFAGLLITVLLLNNFFIQSFYTSSQILNNNLESDSLIVFFGTTHRVNGQTNQYFQNRLQKVLQLHKQNPSSTVLISGYHSDYYSELEATSEQLILDTLDSSQIQLHYANDTFDTMRHLKQVHQTQPTTPIILVSQKFHLQRANFIAQLLQIPVLNFEAQMVTSNSSSIYIHIRELFARIKVYFDLLNYFFS